jgi:lipopolysaccharide transport system permease protein
MSRSVTETLPAHPPAPVPGAPPAIRVESEPDELLIRPRRGWVAVDWREIFRFRELLFFLIWRDVKVRYKQTVLGVAWAVLSPALNTLVFTGVFGFMVGLSKDIPAEWHNHYAPFVYCGQLPWALFSVAITVGGVSLINQQQLLTKIYFPRLFVPSATVGVAATDTVISLAFFLAIILPIAHLAPSWQIVAFVPLLALTIVLGLGISYFLAALTITYRDFKFLVPLIAQAWMFCSPIAYPLEAKTAFWTWIFRLNPMYGIVKAFRSATIGAHWDGVALAMAAAESAAIFLFGLYYFKKTERRFADIA